MSGPKGLQRMKNPVRPEGVRPVVAREAPWPVYPGVSKPRTDGSGSPDHVLRGVPHRLGK